jgi:hypothetical protein
MMQYGVGKLHQEDRCDGNFDWNQRAMTARTVSVIWENLDAVIRCDHVLSANHIPLLIGKSWSTGT